MSTNQTSDERVNLTRTNPFISIANTYMHSDSINEARAAPAPIINDSDESPTWVDSLSRLDRLLSGSLLRLTYLIIDVILLSLGLYYGKNTCSSSSSVIVISICILIFASLELATIFLFFIRNWRKRYTLVVEDTSSNGYPQRNMLHLLRFLCICVGTAFVFGSKTSSTTSCDAVRFYLGIVCFNTWVLWFIAPSKATLPVRRSLVSECLIRFISILIPCFYIGFVLSAVLKVHNSECICHSVEDLYHRAPLKSFGYVGLLLKICIICDRIFDGVINQIFYRARNLRRTFLYVAAIRYLISYLITLCVVYYFSIGAVLLFSSRTDKSCQKVAPQLHKTLLTWQIICVFLPLIVWPLTCLLCCLGVTIGTCLAACLPASITVPLFAIIRERFPTAPGTNTAEPPASPNAINALPDVTFGEISDQFDQKECVICRMEYEANEKVKRLPCGHLFHVECITKWLETTRVCATCRQRITSASANL
ncbi:unnamed protein product [Adineta ricciae]|uniref:RING-type domain-containing protein n=1 Tax=Adineta ricciae TaxID=249248 RepID=A0A814NFF9_ADIRI|nr:unnamed protein product [Adineta ricciae]CAF1222443.1 unnamed protein product [Adineta ricciae]